MNGNAKKGNAIYFENIDSQGKANPQTLHAGMPCWWVKMDCHQMLKGKGIVWNLYYWIKF